MFFPNKQYNFLTNKCEKCPSGFRCWDTNPQPLVHESSPVTTRLGFPPNVILLNYPLYLCSCKLQVVFSPFCTLTAFQFREKEWTRNVVLTASASSIFHPFKSGYFCSSFGLRDVIELNVMSPILCLKMAHHRPLFHLFSSFLTNITIFITIKCDKCPSSIQCRDSNQRPSEYEFLPKATRPGLPMSPILC